MEKTNRKKIIMIIITCIVVILMNIVVITSVVRNSSKNYLLNTQNTILNCDKIESPIKENKYYYDTQKSSITPIKTISYSVSVKVVREGKTFNCKKVICEYVKNKQIEDNELFVGKMQFNNELNKTSLGIYASYPNKIKMIFKNYSGNPGKNVLYIYYTA